MAFFHKILKRIKDKPLVTVQHPDETVNEQKNKAFIENIEQVKKLFAATLYNYNLVSCQCAYPRFQQIIGIDCSETGNSFKCYDTELLIDLSKTYFNIEPSGLNDECTNEKWICKSCGSIYEYGWSDFSIYMERQKLKLVYLAIQPTGKPLMIPIPVCLGLMGHSYPQSTIRAVDFAVFESYMSEQ